VQILLFLVYDAVVILFALALGYFLTAEEEPTVIRRCSKAREMYHRRQTQRQREKCRFEG
jgi:hypothetical protein